MRKARGDEWPQWLVIELELEPAVLCCFHALFTGNKALQEVELHIKMTHACQKNTDLRMESHWRASGWGWRLGKTNPVGTQWWPLSQMKEDGDWVPQHMVPKEIAITVPYPSVSIKVKCGLPCGIDTLGCCNKSTTQSSLNYLFYIVWRAESPRSRN